MQNIVNSVIPSVLNILLTEGNHDCIFVRWMEENYHDKLFLRCQNVFFKLYTAKLNRKDPYQEL